MNIKTLLTVGAACAANSFVASAADNPLDFPEYMQTVTATFATSADAAEAEMSLSPLPDGASRSFGTRWDDTTGAHLKKADMLDRIGVKGAFYITARSGITGKPKSFRYAGLRSLVERGHAVGNHTMSHPFVVDLSPEAAFEQILMARILLERDTDHAVVSYASPFGWYGFNRWLDIAGFRLAVDMLIECGMWVSGDNPIPRLGIPEDVWYPAHRFSANDRNPDHKMFINGLRRQSSIADKSPLSPRITLGTHSWCDEAGNALQEKWMKENCVRPDWVQLNDYEYGAYRYSVINGTVKRVTRSGNVVTFSVRRFCPAALGDAIPLSVSFSRPPVKAVCGGKTLKRGPKATWKLSHDAARKALCKVGLAGADGKCDKLPGVEAVVRPDTGSRNVTVTVVNRTDSAMDDIYGVVHLPPEFKIRRRIFRIASVAAGETAERTFDCADPEPLVYPRGKALYAASVDFSQNASRNRIWSTASTESTGSLILPADTARVTPAVPAATMDNAELKALSAKSGPLTPLSGKVQWMPRDVKATPQEAWYLVSPRTRKMSAEEKAVAGEYAARAIALQFKSEKDGDVTLFTNAKNIDSNAKIYLNGSEIVFSGNKTVISARKGVNRLVLKTHMKTDGYVNTVQLAVSKDGNIGNPCECVPFPE